MAKDNSVREYLAVEGLYKRVFDLVTLEEDVSKTDLRRALDDIYNAGRDKGHPIVGTNGRTVQLEINDLAVRLEDGGLNERSARREAERIASVIAAEAYQKGFRDGQDTPKVTSVEELLAEEEA